MIEFDDNDTPETIDQMVRARRMGISVSELIVREQKLKRAQNAIAEIQAIFEDYRDRGHHSHAERHAEWYTALKDFVPTELPGKS